MSKSIGTLSLYKNKYADSSYKYVRRFQNYQERDSFYDTQPKYTQEQCSFLMENDTVMVDLSYEDARKWNYARFRNESSSEYMYYFISNVVYKAPGVSIIQLDLDNVTTFLFGNYEYEIEGNIERNLNSIIKTSDIQAEDNITSYKAKSVEEIKDSICPEGYSILISSDPLYDNKGDEKYNINNIYSSYYAYLLPSKTFNVSYNAEVSNILQSNTSLMNKDMFNGIEKFTEYMDYTSFQNKGYTSKTKDVNSLNMRFFSLSINEIDNFISLMRDKNISSKQAKLIINGVEETIKHFYSFEVNEKPYTIQKGLLNLNNTLEYSLDSHYTAKYLKGEYDMTLSNSKIQNFLRNYKYVDFQYSYDDYTFLTVSKGVHYTIITNNDYYYLKTFKTKNNNKDVKLPWLLYKNDSKIKLNYSFYNNNRQGVTNNYNYFGTKFIAPYDTHNIDSLSFLSYSQARFPEGNGRFMSIKNIIQPDIMNNYGYSSVSGEGVTLNLAYNTIALNQITPKNQVFSITFSGSSPAETGGTMTPNDIEYSNNKDSIQALYHLPISNEFNEIYKNGNLTYSPYVKYIKTDNNKILINIIKKAPINQITKQIDKSIKNFYPYDYYSFNYGGASLDIKPQYITGNNVTLNFDYDIGLNPTATMFISEEVAYNNGLNKYSTSTQNIPSFPIQTTSWEQYQAYSKALADASTSKSLGDSSYNYNMTKLSQQQAGAQFGVQMGQTLTNVGMAFARGGIGGAVTAGIGAAGSAIGGAINLGFEKERTQAQLENIDRQIDYTNQTHILNEQIQRQKPAIQINAATNMSSFLTESNKIKFIKWGLHDTEKDIINDRWNRIGFLLNKYKTSENINGLLFNNDIFDYLKFSENRLYSPSISIGNKQVLETALNTGITFIDKSTEAIESFKNNTEKPLFEIIDLPERFTYDQEYILHFKKRTDEYLNIYIDGYEEYLEGFITASIDNNEGTFSITFNSDDPVNSIKIFFKCEEYPEFQYVVTGIPQ